MRQIVVMVATSYPRFPGDGVGSFMEPIAKGVARRGHDVHIVAPWHPAIRRPAREDGVSFHFFKYAPLRSLNVFGYAEGLRRDTDLRTNAWAVAPLALAAGWRAASKVRAKTGATIMHGHWVIPGGLIAAAAAGRCPLVVSLHGSDVYVAERHPVAERAARRVFARAAHITACSDDLAERARALGASADRTETLPYGVDTTRFAPSAEIRAAVRLELGLDDAPLVFAAGRLVSKKGFEVLIEAAERLRSQIPRLSILIAGDGDLQGELDRRARATQGTVRLLGARSQDDVGRLAAAADVVAVPSVHDERGNVDGLPNFALEALASATPVVASMAGGLPSVVEDGVTGRLVTEKDAAGLADALAWVLTHPADARRLGRAARERVSVRFGWDRYASRLEEIYAQSRS